MGRYRRRTALRRHLPWALIRLGVARKGARDCGDHEWYREDADEDRCLHCEVGLRRPSAWGPASQAAPRD